MRKGILYILTATLTMLYFQGAQADYRRAASGPSYYVSAPVLDVQPITHLRTVNEPVRQCRRYPDRDPRGYGHDRYDDGYGHRDEGNYLLPSLFGGVVGGLIGNQFGGGHGKDALTIAGAIAGSSIARSAARQRHRSPREICETTYQSRVVESIDAYDVTYEYAGRQFTRRMSSHPGDYVRVRVEHSPALADRY